MTPESADVLRWDMARFFSIRFEREILGNEEKFSRLIYIYIAGCPPLQSEFGISPPILEEQLFFLFQTSVKLEIKKLKKFFHTELDRP